MPCVIYQFAWLLLAIYFKWGLQPPFVNMTVISSFPIKLSWKILIYVLILLICSDSQVADWFCNLNHCVCWLYGQVSNISHIRMGAIKYFIPISVVNEKIPIAGRQSLMDSPLVIKAHTYVHGQARVTLSYTFCIGQHCSPSHGVKNRFCYWMT